jgi:16S rRNA (guanine527-N7)-methyltransferase
VSSGPLGSTLDAVLEEARRLGFLGPGPLAAQIAHSLAFRTLVVEPPRFAVDLGSGGGLPGLPLALSWVDSSWVLLDASHRRADFLVKAIAALGLQDRVTVSCRRAEAAGRDPDQRNQADLVVARGFGPPAVTAECAAPLTRVGGIIVVAEPPGGDPNRWPEQGLSVLGLVRGAAVASPYALQRLETAAPCPDRFPRRTGIPAKRPLF